MLFFDIWYFVFIGPAMLLGMWAQYRVRHAFEEGSRVPAPMTGFAAARSILDSSGLHDVAIERSSGYLSDHYDPRGKVLRLSPDVYGSNSMAAVGVAAHEAGHALQDAKNYPLLPIRNTIVPLANFGSSFGVLLIILGLFLSKFVAWIGVAAFSMVVLFQLFNLPVEFDASNRAKRQLGQLGIVNDAHQGPINKVLNAAALTYVAATLQSISTLAYFLFRVAGRR